MITDPIFFRPTSLFAKAVIISYLLLNESFFSATLLLAGYNHIKIQWLSYLNTLLVSDSQLAGYSHCEQVQLLPRFCGVLISSFSNIANGPEIQRKELEN